MSHQSPQAIIEAFESRVEKHPNKTAIVFLGTKFSYSEIGEYVKRFAAALYEMGVNEGEKMIIYIPNSPQWVIAWFGIQKAGGIAVPITPIYTSYDLQYIANDSGAETVICADTNYGYVQRAMAGSNIRRVIVTNVVDLLPWWKRVFGKAFDKVPSGKVSKDSKTYLFKKLMRQSGSLPQRTESKESRIIEILYTGGTTKFPKGVPITHDLFMESAEEQLNISASLFPMEENAILAGAPLFHILGQACELATLCFGGTLILQPKVNLDGMLETIQRFKAKTFVGVPTLYRMILEHDRIDFYDIQSLRYCFCAGDVLPVEIGARWFEKYKKMIYQGYGATETCGGVTMCPVGVDNPPRSMGLVVPSKKVKIVDPDTLEPVPLGEPGELIVSSDRMVKAYWNKPEETAVSFVELEGRKWYRTGDIISMDEKGHLYFVDRTVDTIKHKGYRVSASEIESVLQEHPAVIGACVVGVPDQDVGERIKAFVVLKEDIKGITGYDLLKWCRQKLASYKVPQYIEFRDMLPKSKVGKLLRREMRAEERKRQEKTE
ncbi:MAG: long-chain fatty acid--CoA ligase [Deltaproteobacteria bacterium]|nr:long-chain fatty acid--CoA ligase [Deltaproteobacteria bacterium]